MSKREFIAASAALTGALLVSKTAVASTKYEVLMLNKDPDNSKNKMIFSPRLLKVQVGDEVSFVPTDKGHNSATIKGMLPAGAEKWKGKINKQVDVVFDTPGFYGYQCTPHANMGMIGLIIVEGDGMLDNLEEAKSAKHRGKAKKAWKALWEEADAEGLTG
jgi:pseudoazurin